MTATGAFAALVAKCGDTSPKSRPCGRERCWLWPHSLAFVSGNMAIFVLTWQEDRFVVSASLYGHTNDVKCLSFRPGCVWSRCAAETRPGAGHPAPRALQAP